MLRGTPLQWTPAIWTCCYFVWTVSLSPAYGAGGIGTTDGTSGCFRAVYAEQDLDDVRILCSGGGSSTEPYEIVRLSNHSLPAAGCEPNFAQCSLQCFPCEEGRDLECCTLPVLNGRGDNSLALLQLEWAASNTSSNNATTDNPGPRTLTLRNHTVINHGQDCTTAHVYIRASNSHSNPHFVDCINITASSQAYMFFLNLMYNIDNVAQSAQLSETSYFARFEDFPGSLSLSEILYLQSFPGDCSSVRSVFFVANAQGYMASERDSFNFIFEWGPIEDCLFPLDVNYIEVDESFLLRVQCSQFVTKLFTACGSLTTVATYDSRVNGTMHQCRKGEDLRGNLTFIDDSVTFTTAGNIQDFGNIVPSHSFPFTQDMVYGFCLVGSDVSFVFGLSNGSVLSLSFSTGKFSTIANNSCDSSSTDTYVRGHCYKAHTAMNGQQDVVVGYDYVGSQFKAVDLSCPGNPVVERLTVEPRPPLAGFLVDPQATCGGCPPVPSPSSPGGSSTLVSSSVGSGSTTSIVSRQTVALSTNSPAVVRSPSSSISSIVPASTRVLPSTPTTGGSGNVVSPSVSTSLNETGQEDNLRNIFLPIAGAIIAVIITTIIIVVLVVLCLKRRRRCTGMVNGNGGLGLRLLGSTPNGNAVGNTYATTSLSTGTPQSLNGGPPPTFSAPDPAQESDTAKRVQREGPPVAPLSAHRPPPPRLASNYRSDNHQGKLDVYNRGSQCQGGAASGASGDPRETTSRQAGEAGGTPPPTPSAPDLARESDVAKWVQQASVAPPPLPLVSHSHNHQGRQDVYDQHSGGAAAGASGSETGGDPRETTSRQAGEVLVSDLEHSRNRNANLAASGASGPVTGGDPREVTPHQAGEVLVSDPENPASGDRIESLSNNQTHRITTTPAAATPDGGATATVTGQLPVVPQHNHVAQPPLPPLPGPGRHRHSSANPHTGQPE